MPICSSVAGKMPLTVDFVPTGMKMGVGMSPCGVWKTPARACVEGSSATMS